MVVQAHVVDADEGSAAGHLDGGAVCVIAVQVADEHPVGRELLVQDDVQIVQGIGAEADGDRDAGGLGGAGGAAEQAFLGRGHAGAVGDGGDDAGGGAALDPGNHHPLGDLLAEEVGELLGRPRGGRVGLRRQEVSAEFFLRAQPRGGDDVDAGGAGQRLVELEVAAVEHAGAVDDRLAAVLAEVGELRGQGLEDLRPVHGDVRGVLGAGEHRQQGLMDRDNAQFGSRDGTQDRVDGLPGRGAAIASPERRGVG